MQYLVVWVVVYLGYAGEVQGNAQEIVGVIEQACVKDLVRKLVAANVTVD